MSAASTRDVGNGTVSFYCGRCELGFSTAIAHPTLGPLCPLCLHRMREAGIRTGPPAPALVRLYRRDRGVCWLCRAPVDERLMGQVAPGAPTRDHVIPRSRGGSNDMGNLRLAHSWCNLMRSRRGDVGEGGRPLLLTPAQVAEAHRMFGSGTASDR